MDCTECRWADTARAPRTLVQGQMRITQAKGGITCTRGSVRELTITDDGIRCSEFEEAPHADAD